jgi:hypothetical protein
LKYLHVNELPGAYSCHAALADLDRHLPGSLGFDHIMLDGRSLARLYIVCDTLSFFTSLENRNEAWLLLSRRIKEPCQVVRDLFGSVKLTPVEEVRFCKFTGTLARYHKLSLSTIESLLPTPALRRKMRQYML